MRAPKIGVIDSGAGGLTVLTRLVEQMPYQPFVYLADTAWCPYGPRKRFHLQYRIVSIVAWLLAQQCEMIVVACNTATASTIAHLRKSFKVPFIGMEPALKPAAQNSKTKEIGVLATAATLTSSMLKQTANRHAKGCKVHLQQGSKLVELVEDMQYETDLTYKTVQEVVDPLLEHPIDKLVLGCTHYPFLSKALHAAIRDEIEIIDPSPAVARYAKQVWLQHHPPIAEKDMRRTPITLYSTGKENFLDRHLTYYSQLLGFDRPDYRLAQAEIEKL